MDRVEGDRIERFIVLKGLEGLEMEDQDGAWVSK